MAHLTRENVEILVHTSAPSRGQDDTRYRAFATAYLNFEPATDIPLQDDPQFNTNTNEESQVQIEEDLQSTQEYDENASYCPPSQEPETNPGAYREITEEELGDLMYSPQLSFRSVLDNRDSPMLRMRSRIAVGAGMLSGENRSGQSQDGLRTQFAEETTGQSQFDLGTQFAEKSSGQSQFGSGNQFAEESSGQSEFRNSLPAQKQSTSAIEHSMPATNRAVPEFSSPRRILQLQLQQGESTQDSPEVSRRSQLTDESSLSLEVPQAIPFSSSQARINSDVSLSQSPKRSRATSPPRRAHTNRFRHISLSSVPISDKETSDAMGSSGSNDMPPSGAVANAPNRRTSQTMETDIAAKSTNEETTSASVTMKGPAISTPEILVASNLLPQNANGNRRRVEFPSSVDRSPKRVKLVISDTTAETSSASLPKFQIPSTSIAPETPVIPSSIPSTAGSVSEVSLKKHEISQIVPETSSEDFVPSDLTPYLRRIISTGIDGKRLQNVYKPDFQTRDCRPTERGYWLLNTKSNKRVENLWSYLDERISSGDFGFGVWATRDGWESITVFCWGGIVKEIYLALYLGSHGHLRGWHACWKDSDKESIIYWKPQEPTNTAPDTDQVEGATSGVIGLAEDVGDKPTTTVISDT